MQTIDNSAVLRKVKEAQTNNAEHQDSSTQWESLAQVEEQANDAAAEGQRAAANLLMQSATAQGDLLMLLAGKELGALSTIRT